jgi:flagellar motility protein MotE (MotC chaperone)
MNYEGKLYAHIGGKKYFDTGKTGKDWDKLEEQLSIEQRQNEMLIQELHDKDEEIKKLKHLLHLSEGTIETHEEIGFEQHEKIKELIKALNDMADYYLFEKELDTDEHIDMTNRVEIIIEKNKHFQ